MKRSTIETILGAVVLAIAGLFLAFSYKTADIGAVEGYAIIADFAGTGGLKPGDDVTISGVKVGTVDSVRLMPDTYLARVTMDVASSLKLPADSSAVISSQSIMGGRYLALEPGADEEIIPPGGKIEYTQAPQNLEQLLGKFIFSMEKGKGKEGEQSAALDAPAEIPAQTIEKPLATPPGAKPERALTSEESGAAPAASETAEPKATETENAAEPESP